MARITIEDCLNKVPNKFELCILATKRAVKLKRKMAYKLVETNNKSPVIIALREIAAGKVKINRKNNKEKEKTKNAGSYF